VAKTKVEVLFSDDEVAQLFAELQALPKGKRTGRFVNEWAAKRGHYVSVQSGIKTVKGPFDAFLEDLKEKKRLADNVTTIVEEGLDLPKAAAAAFSAKVLDAALNVDSADIGSKSANNISLAIARLGVGSDRAKFLETRIREIEQKMDLQQFDAAQAAIKHAKEIRGVMADKSLDGAAKTERVREILFGQKPADFKPVTDKGAQAE
jgi:hypothetical protein